MSHRVTAVAVSTALCISTVLGSPMTPSDPFHVTIASWPLGIHLKHCDFEINPSAIDVGNLESFTLHHAGILAVQNATCPEVRKQLLPDGPNIFFCSKNANGKKFVVLLSCDGKWQRSFYKSLPVELTGKKARFFVPHKPLKA